MISWKTWGGGAMPVSCDEVFYRVRHSPDVELGPVRPDLLRWDHGRTPESAADPSLRSCDIIAYRVVPARQMEVRAAQGIDVPSGIETAQTGSTEGESPVA